MRRLDYLGIVFVLLNAVLCAIGMRQMETNTEDVLQWLPDQSIARADYNYFEKYFGSDDFVIVTWDGCHLGDSRLSGFAEKVRALDSAQLVDSLITGEEVAQRLSDDLKMSQPAIARRLRGVFFGMVDPQQTCAMVELSSTGTSNRLDAMNLIQKAIEATPQLDYSQVSMGGYPFIAITIDQQLKNSFRYFLAPSVLFATVVALICLRNWCLTLIVFFTAMGAAMMSMAVVPMAGCKFGGLMSIIPALVFVLTTSGCIHLIRYSLVGKADPLALLKIGWKPCAISASTTAVGMLSLTRSDFPAIRNFGFFCAVGVGFSLAFQLVLVPWLLSRFGKPGVEQLARRSENPWFWRALLKLVGRYRWTISTVCAVVMILGGVGLCFLHAEVEVEKLFRDDSPVLCSIAELEQYMGPLDQTEVLLVFQDAPAETFPDRVNQVRMVQAALSKLTQVETTHSLINYLPLEPDSSSARSFFRRSVYRSILRRERESLANQRFLLLDDESETWRISLRFPFTRKNDFEQLALDVNASVGASSRSMNLEAPELAPKLIYTGKTQLFQHAQMTLLRDLFQNFLLAFVIITPMLIIVLRSVSIGMIAMLPNLFPTLLLFGGLGWAGFPVDLAIAMTASVALGIAVDDTTHFLIRFRDFGGSLQNVAVPMEQTIVQCGPAMLHTTLIGCAGLIVYYFGDMLVVSRFSLAISTLLMIAVVADVVMLPAILSLFRESEGKSATP